MGGSVAWASAYVHALEPMRVSGYALAKYKCPRAASTAGGVAPRG